MATKAPEPTVAELKAQLADMTRQRDNLAAAARDAEQPHLVRRWEVDQGEEKALANEPVYQLTIERTSEGAYIMFAPPHTSPDQIVGMPQLSMILEVSGGVPSAYVHGADGEGLAVKIHALPNGVIGLSRPDFLVETLTYDRDPDPKEMAAEIATLAERNAKAIADAAAEPAPKG